MKRIFTLIVIALFSLNSKSVIAQCTSSASPLNGLTATDYKAGGLQTDFVVGNGGVGNNNGQTNVINSAIYYFNTVPGGTLNFGYKFSTSTNSNLSVQSYTIDVISGTNGTHTIASCTGSTGFTVTALYPATQTIYFSVPVSNFPKSTNFQINLTVTVSSTGTADLMVSQNNFLIQGTALSTQNAALPVNFLGLEAKKLSNGTQLTWKVAQEMDVNTYELERSTDGKGFTTVATVAATGNTSYSATDYSSAAPVVYYRVKNTDKDGRYKFSTTIKVEGGKISFLKKAFPMPAVSEVFLQHDAVVGNAVITLSSQDGRVVKTIAPQAGSMQTRIDLSGLNSGLYLVRYDDGTGAAETLKVVKQ